MSMKEVLTAEDVRSNFQSAFANAFREQSESGMSAAVEQYAVDLNKAMLAEYQSMSDADRNDTAVLAQRGVRQLTGEENRYYSAVIEAMREPAGNVRSALTNLTVTMPETIIDQVMTDIATEFPLLNAVNFVNSTYMTSFIYNNQSRQIAKWGDLGSAVDKELSGAFSKISVDICKLTAYMAVSMDYLDLGAAWLDRYVRAVLTEASGMAFETAIVDGAGAVSAAEAYKADGTLDGDAIAECPIGMTRDVSAGTTANDHTTYARKSAKTITELTPAVYGEIIAAMAVTPTGRARAVNGLIMVVNPTDYYTKVMPATTVQLPGGGYAHDVLPVPTQIIQSVAMPSGKAVIGIGQNYLALLGLAKVSANSKQGVITYSDETQFLADNRVYKIRLLGNGRPVDNNSFVYCDISGLTPLYYNVKEVSGT